MAGYWKSVFSGAWDKTYKPLGWDRKKAAVALVAVGTIIVAALHLGWSEMITTAAGYLWIAIPSVFTAFILFIWGIIETQAKLYADIAAKLGTTDGTPNYAVWRNRNHIYLGDAACLFADLVPNSRNKARADVNEYLGALVDAAKHGEMEFVFRDSAAAISRAILDREKQYVDNTTKVTRAALKKFAEKRGYNPPFLSDG